MGRLSFIPLTDSSRTPANVSPSGDTWGSSGWGDGWGDTDIVSDDTSSSSNTWGPVSSESTLAAEDDDSDSTQAQGNGDSHSSLNWGNSHDEWYFHSHADCAPLIPCRIADAAIEHWVRHGFINPDSLNGETVENMWAELEPILPSDTLLAPARRTTLAELKCHVLAALRALSHLPPRADDEPGIGPA
ncbi:hypothetical protein B0H12DRAFT_1233712 [Mycena haematopus]|nr:hypothetical protein B0H12DRAFT_1233712 [Mycena haematopus]